MTTHALTHPQTAAEPTEDAHLASARALRLLALDEATKRRVMSEATLAALARQVAHRYLAGETLPEALDRARDSVRRGHAVSLELVGESVRDADEARRATEVFVSIAEQIRLTGLPSTISLDLTHLGLLVDRELGHRHAVRVAQAARDAGTVLMLSAEGSERTDLVLDTYERLSETCPGAVGVTLQARLHRTPEDLARVLGMPGRVRLVKGAFEEPEHVAHPRESEALHRAYLRLADVLVTHGGPVSLATHDDLLLDELVRRHGDALRGDQVEFEMLLGLGDAALERLRRDGHRTREYVVFGSEWWLYVLNRISERPERLHTALADASARTQER
ncbi:proline dehydrogenase family protein [Nocardioides sp. 503]|uniref:proline dehydrogenase family protein n=1 Tax=Nocardioides sp. 503 TaxID=2508326 RepID=UPI00106F6733|nr:proline dehydrogenase family protein [Nocardioides sp. 503]